jgi:hypothetical protein
MNRSGSFFDGSMLPPDKRDSNCMYACLPIEPPGVIDETSSRHASWKEEVAPTIEAVETSSKHVMAKVLIILLDL